MTRPYGSPAGLTTAYARTSGPVAFIDESYRTQPEQGERAFYSMSAVTFDQGDFVKIRADLRRAAGRNYWHSTEAFREGRFADISAMSDVVATHAQWNIVTIQVPVHAGEGAVLQARSNCLGAIAREVTRGAGAGAVRLLVVDRNKDERLNRLDVDLLKHLRTTNRVARDVTVRHASMGAEPLLWAADVVSWSAYRTLAVGDQRWLAPIQEVLTVLNAETSLPLNMKQPQAAAASDAVASPPGARRLVASSRGEDRVASDPSVTPPSAAPLGDHRYTSAILDDIARQTGRQRVDARLAAIAQRTSETPVSAALEQLVQDRLRAGDTHDDERPRPGLRGPHL